MLSETDVFCSTRDVLLYAWKVFDEGGGKVRVIVNEREEHLGIYRRDRDRFTISIRPAYRGRPATFVKGDYQDLFTLHRVKPRK